MNKVKMKTPTGQIMSRIPEEDVAYHMKNGWELIDEGIQDKPEKKKKSAEPKVQVDLTLDLNEENE